MGLLRNQHWYSLVSVWELIPDITSLTYVHERLEDRVDMKLLERVNSLLFLLHETQRNVQYVVWHCAVSFPVSGLLPYLPCTRVEHISSMKTTWYLSDTIRNQPWTLHWFVMEKNFFCSDSFIFHFEKKIFFHMSCKLPDWLDISVLLYYLICTFALYNFTKFNCGLVYSKELASVFPTITLFASFFSLTLSATQCKQLRLVFIHPKPPLWTDVLQTCLYIKCK